MILCMLCLKMYFIHKTYLYTQRDITESFFNDIEGAQYKVLMWY